MFESAHCMNSGAMFVLSAGFRLLSQREPQSLPVDALSFVGPVFHSFSFYNFFVVLVLNVEIFKQLIQMRNYLNMEYNIFMNRIIKAEDKKNEKKNN